MAVCASMTPALSMLIIGLQAIAATAVCEPGYTALNACTSGSGSLNMIVPYRGPDDVTIASIPAGLNVNISWNTDGTTLKSKFLCNGTSSSSCSSLSSCVMGSDMACSSRPSSPFHIDTSTSAMTCSGSGSRRSETLGASPTPDPMVFQLTRSFGSPGGSMGNITYEWDALASCPTGGAEVCVLAPASPALVCDATMSAVNACQDGSAQTTVQLTMGQTVPLAMLPPGLRSVSFNLSANADLDAKLRYNDTAQWGAGCEAGFACNQGSACPSVGTPCFPTCQPNIYFSGDDTSDPVSEAVFITEIKDLMVFEGKAYSDLTGTVVYSWTGMATCPEGGASVCVVGTVTSGDVTAGATANAEGTVSSAPRSSDLAFIFLGLAVASFLQ